MSLAFHSAFVSEPQGVDAAFAVAGAASPTTSVTPSKQVRGLIASARSQPS